MAWLGTKTGMSVVSGDLQLDAGAEEGSYLIKDGVNSYVDTGAVGRYRINLQFDAKESGGVIGDDSNEIKIKLEIDLATAAGPNWLGWRPYLPGEYYCQWYRIRATVKVDDAFGNRPKFLRFEHNHVRIGSIPMAASIDDLKTAPTGTEPQGTRYIVIATATGDFTGKAMQIAELVETTDRTWEFAIPVDRQEVYNLNGGWKYRYEGTFPAGGWVPRGLNVTNPEEDKFVGAVTVVGVKNHLWDTDGGGDIGAVGANRPDYVHAKTGMTIAGVAVVAGGAPSPHLLGGGHHSPDSLTNLNIKVTGGNLDFNTAQRTPIIHNIGSNLRHGGDSLANLNALIAGGNLDFDSASRPPIGSASGDLASSYPGPTVAKIRGSAVQDHAPEDGEILKWIDGNSQYEPAGPVGCYVYRNAALTLTDGDWVKIPFDTEVFDLGGNYDSSVNYRFDVPTDGYYLVIGRVRIATPPDGTMMAIGIKRSGTFLATNYRVSGGAWTETLQITFLLVATATQYIEVFAFQDSAGDEAITIGTHTTMQIMKLL